MKRFALASLLALLFACGSEEASPPNVLLVTVDTLRPDRLSAYGFAGHETPHIDALAAAGALFENAFTDAPWTTPAMASVMTGAYPTFHGFRSTNANRLGLEHETLAERLRERGYATAAIIGSFPLDSIYQLDQGFDVYDDEFTLPIWKYPGLEPEALESEFKETPEDQAIFALVKAVNNSRRTDAQVTDAAIAWLDGATPDAPFFLWVHFFGPHSKPDWTLPEEKRFRAQFGQYDPDVVLVDREIGRLLERFDTAGLRDRTLVVFHADHAESLGEQGYIGHGMKLNDATMRIPLILRYPPRVAAGVRVGATVRNIDILPTILDVVGAPIPDTARGASLLPLARRAVDPGDDPEEPERVAYMETYYTAHRAFAPPVRTPDGAEYPLGRVHRAVRAGRFQLVRTEPHPLLDMTDALWEDAPPEALEAARSEILVDVEDDADEPRDLRAEHPEIAARLGALLDAHLAEDRGAAPRLSPDDETRLRLESLGYGGETAPDEPPQEDPIPADRPSASKRGSDARNEPLASGASERSGPRPDRVPAS
jgi:arylsulfatase A-like enzyme